jgi:hypothetical protein
MEYADSGSLKNYLKEISISLLGMINTTWRTN